MVEGAEDAGFGAVFAEVAEFAAFEDGEGFGGVVGAFDVGGVEDVVEFLAGEVVFHGDGGIDFGAELGAALGIEGEGFACVAEVGCPGAHCMGCVGEFQDAGDEEVAVLLGEAVGRQDGELFCMEGIETDIS